MNILRTIKYLALILALPLLLSLNCGDDETEVQSTTTPHNFRKPDALAIVSDPEDGEKEFLFIANSTKGTIAIVDLEDDPTIIDADDDSSNGTNPISINGITPVPDSRIIRDLALNPDGTIILAAWVGPTAGFLSAIDIRGVFTKSGAGPQTTIALSGQPHSIAVSSGTVYITCSEPESIVSVICEGNTVTCQEKEILPLPNSPRNITISEDSRFAYVTFFDSTEIATVSIAGPMTLAAPLLSVSAGTISGTPIDLAIDPDTEEAYVTIASPTPYQLAVVDISSPTQGQFLGTTYDLANLPRQVEVTPQPINANGTTNRLVYVTNLTGQLHLIDDGAVSTISIETLPGGIAISADGERAYIANTGSDSISVVDSIEFEVIDTIR